MAQTADEHAMVLCDGLLIEACRTYELGSLASLLQRRLATALPTTHTVSEALEFLIAQRMPSKPPIAHLADRLNAQTAGELQLLVGQTLAVALNRRTR
jgi:hypothetical protein